MTAAEEAAKQSVIVFTAGERAFTVRDVIDNAFFRGDLQPIWESLLYRVAAEDEADAKELEVEGHALDDSSDAFRYQHDLITAEETEKWLSARALTMLDFSGFLSRRYWGNTLDVDSPATEFPDADQEMRELLAAELMFSDDFEPLSAVFGWRVAAGRAAEDLAAEAVAKERARFLERHEIAEDAIEDWLGRLGRDADWLEETVHNEAAFGARSDEVVTEEAAADELASLRLPLTRFEVEIIQFDSSEAAREALLCVRDDGMSMEEVAGEGGYPFRTDELILENIPEEWQQKYLSVRPGALVGPIEADETCELYRVLTKTEPSLEDEDVRARIRERLMARHFEELCAYHVQWRLLYQMTDDEG